MSNGQALNAYAYVYNDPLNFVDPSGNVRVPDWVPNSESLEWTLNNPGKATRYALRDGAANVLMGIDWWYSKPDKCGCTGGSRLENALWYFDNQAYQFGLNYVTDPVSYRANVSGGIGGQSLATKTNYNITKWGPRGPVRNSKYIVTQLDDGYMVQNKGGKAFMRVQNPRPGIEGGNPGIITSILGAGFIDAAFQFIKDKAIDNLCLSPNQFFWRGIVAFLFGTAAAIAGVGAVIALGVTGGTAAIVAFSVSLTASTLMSPAKNWFLDTVTAGQAR